MLFIRQLSRYGRETEYALVGGTSYQEQVTQQSFGVGYANLQYRLNDVQISKVFSMQPSMELHQGNPSILLEVTLTNNSDKSATIHYREEVLARYLMMNDQNRFESTGELRASMARAAAASCGMKFCRTIK